MSGASLVGLIARLVEEGKAYAVAEVGVAKATARAWLTVAKIAVPLIFVALFLLQAALVVLVAAVGMALSPWLGMAGGLAVSAILTLIVAGLLIGFAIRRLSRIGE
jgi:hypothetical protein